MVEQLTLEFHNDGDAGFYTVYEFWDCECEGDDYIQLKNSNGINHCLSCEISEEDDYPDSRLNEVLDKYPNLYDVPWVMCDGTPADKSEVRSAIERYLASIA